MRLELHVAMDSGAFKGYESSEAARILRVAAQQLDSFGVAPVLDSPFRLRDENGNRVGYFVVTENALVD